MIPGQPDTEIRVKFIIPFPLGDDGMRLRVAQIPARALAPTTAVVSVPVESSFEATLPEAGDSFFEASIMEQFVIRCGATAEDEGFDAVVMDTISDSGLRALQSRLSIPVVGPGQT